MNDPKFKVGDKLKPLKKGISNYWQLKGLIELEVINNNLNPNWSKKILRLKVIKGYTNNNMTYRCANRNDTIELYEDSLELIVPVEEDYSIF